MLQANGSETDEVTLRNDDDGGYKVHGAPKPTLENHIVVEVDNESEE